MSIGTELVNGVGLWITRAERKQERDDAAIRSVLTAVNTTKLYLAARNRSEPIDRGIEGNLVELWTTASVHIRRTDFELAQLLLDKAQYWADPESWTHEEVVANGIEIDEISAKARRLLGDD